MWFGQRIVDGVKPVIWKKAIAYCFLGILISTTIVSISSSEPQYGGRLSVGMEYQAYGFDLIKSRIFTVTAQTAAHLIMERLFDKGEDGEFLPRLGLSMTPSKDGKTWTIHLRQGVLFHDGTPFNADSVVGHWQRILNPENRFRGRLALKPIMSVEKAGEFKVQFNLKHPWKPFPDMLCAGNTMAALIPSPRAVVDGTQNISPVGTGPFVFASWKKQDRISVTKNLKYWQPGKPYLDEIVIHIIPDAQARNAALTTGQVEMIFTDRPAQVMKLQADQNFTTLVGEGTGIGALVINTRKPPLDDVRVRRALAHAWDQRKYIKMVFKDIVPFATHWYGGESGCNDVAYRHPDLAKAKALMQDYRKPVEIEYIHSATQRGIESGLVVQQLFKPIGIKVNTVPLNWGAISKRMFERNFDLASWGIPSMDDMGVATQLIFQSKSPWNLSGYSNETVDALLIKQASSVDQDIREKIWCDVARHVNQDAPVLFFCGRRYYLFAALNVRGLTPPHNQNIRISNAWLIH